MHMESLYAKNEPLNHAFTQASKSLAWRHFSSLISHGVAFTSFKSLGVKWATTI